MEPKVTVVHSFCARPRSEAPWYRSGCSRTVAVSHGIICETYTNGQVQIGAGDFTFHVKNGWLVESGKVTAPVKDVKITGNGPELLKRVTMVADDARLDMGGWTCGKNGQSVPVSQGIPTVLVSSMLVGA